MIINIVDATNLSRSLFFTTQLLELDIPVVVALNKSDINEKKGTKIDVQALAGSLGCPVVETVSTSAAPSANGLSNVINAAVTVAGKGQKAPFEQGDINLHNKEEVEAADRKRFEFVNKVVEEVETRRVLTRERNFQDKIDGVLTNKFLGVIIFAAVMFVVFDLSQSTLGPFLADMLVGWIKTFQEWAAGMVEGASPFLQALLIDGIIGGVGAVVGFLPLVMVMYFLIALLEDCGYMACRTIKNERERRATAMLTPFMPCGVKLPVIALFAGAFFGNASWVGTLMYFAGIMLILLGAFGTGFIWGLIAVAVMAAFVVYLIKREEKTFDREYGVKTCQI